MTSTSTSHDDAFHEIQLNGKQLFFLFMAATVVSVVIFLCGVLVGRGVRAERTAADLEALNSSSPAPDATPPGTTPGGAGADPTIVLPPPPAEEISEVSPNAPVAGEEKKAEAKPEPKVEKPAPAAAKPEPSPAKPAAPAPKPTPASTTGAAAGTTRTAAATPSPAAGARDWFVQIAAVQTKSDADTQLKKLSAKGHSGYVVPPGDGTNFYRVRVGSFKTRPEAQHLADKLQKDLGITPYVNFNR